VTALITGLDVAYDLGPGHPLLGRRTPDRDLLTSDGPVRLFELLHEARPVLLELGGPGLHAGAWSGRVRHVRATSDGPWRLPVLGEVPPPTGVLVRPDGHAAWVGEDSEEGLDDALTTWFGRAGR
jgi:3-(3-hydroxy-phenyl)propionate hydroxylase